MVYTSPNMPSDDDVDDDFDDDKLPNIPSLLRYAHNHRPRSNNNGDDGHDDDNDDDDDEKEEEDSNQWIQLILTPHKLQRRPNF